MPPNCIEDFLEAYDVWPVTKKFLEEEVVPRVAKVIEEFGDGWLEIHTREINALLNYVQGKCK